MKPRDTTLQALRREVEEQIRKVEDLERIIREFEVMAGDLDRQIRLEEDRTGIRDPLHFSYSTFARSATQRRDKLLNSMQGLRAQLETAVRDRDDMSEKMTRTLIHSEGRPENRTTSRRRIDRQMAAVR